MNFASFIEEYLLFDAKLAPVIQKYYPSHVPYHIKPSVHISIPNPEIPGTVCTICNISACLDDNGNVYGFNCMCSDVKGKTVWNMITNLDWFKIEAVTLQ